MKAAEYLDAAKERLCLSSDYELAKKLEVPKQYISAYRKGIRTIGNYEAMKLAITLELDPAHVIADLEAQREKNAERAAFWRSFLGRAAMVAMVAGTLALSSFDRSVSAPAFAGGLSAIIAAHLFYRRQRSDNVYYVKLWIDSDTAVSKSATLIPERFSLKNRELKKNIGLRHV